MASTEAISLIVSIFSCFKNKNFLSVYVSSDGFYSLQKPSSADTSKPVPMREWVKYLNVVSRSRQSKTKNMVKWKQRQVTKRSDWEKTTLTIQTVFIFIGINDK